ncbi:Glycosyl transferase family 2 [Cohnella sp. OV330]|uniref:glycosyltransferase family 2 protein n=1 Tax=Cohnella sp. OV330 TaxID=1855288 RepID=UPI0008F04383|nr:glycosyltransferase [Cohnella sp. OV330]SFB44424.1 Glycosyl transferase family 2 [Cohnella sp. OV330]
MPPIVTVVIPFYNDPYINEAIDSVLAQTYRPIEIVVVDDGSSRHADRILPAYAGSVRYIGKANGGTASALNAGIRASTGEYIAWLSSDDRFRPDKIERQLNYMRERHARICCTDFAVIDGSGTVVDSRYGTPYPDGLALMRLLATTNAINGCTVMMRKDIFAIVGEFNESLRFTQDYDFWARTVLSGIRIDYLAVPLTEYRMHGGMGTVQNKPGLMAEYDGLRAFYGLRIASLFAEGGTFG